MISVSAKLTPAAATAMRTWPTANGREGMSSILSVWGPPKARQTTARMGNSCLESGDGIYRTDVAAGDIGYRGLEQGLERGDLAVVETRVANQQGRHRHLGGTCGTVVDLEGDAEATRRDAGRIDAFGAGLEQRLAVGDFGRAGAEPA